MRTAIDSRKFQAGLLLAGLRTPIFLWPGFGSRTFSAAGFLPHSPAMLAWRVHKARKRIAFSAVFPAFGVVIVASTLTHLIEVWMLWQPRYRLASE